MFIRIYSTSSSLDMKVIIDMDIILYLKWIKNPNELNLIILTIILKEWNYFYLKIRSLRGALLHVKPKDHWLLSKLTSTIEEMCVFIIDKDRSYTLLNESIIGEQCEFFINYNTYFVFICITSIIIISMLKYYSYISLIYYFLPH